MKRMSRTFGPGALLHGGGGENVPADRETRYAPYDCGRETKA